MVRVGRACAVAVVALVCLPSMAAAGGGEFPADGVIGIGRGGTSFTRADDGSVMLRNPALLADLWGDQLMLGAHILAHDSCFQATGAHKTRGDSVDYGNGVVVLNADPGSTDLDGNPLPSNLVDDDTSLGQMEDGRYLPYPEVCFEGPIPYLPQLVLSMKLADDIGVGLAFLPPETSAAGQFGNRDGTVDTANGVEPSPLRYTGSHVNASYFSVAAAAGWRMNDWLRVGAGFQWAMVAVNSVGFAPGTDRLRGPSGDTRIDTFLRDLFIPAFVASVHAVPMDELDVAVGFKWADSVRARAKLDITTRVWGTGETFTYLDEDGEEVEVGSGIPTTTHNVEGRVSAPPIWHPQLSFGVRYADRLKPRVRDWNAAKTASRGAVEDHMSMERWDVELTAVVYFSEVRDFIDFVNDGETADAAEIIAGGVTNDVSGPVGKCIEDDPSGGCAADNPLRRSRTPLHGQTQYSLRLGGDYNVLPGIFSVRTGVSYETEGSDIAYFDPKAYDQERIGLHAGWTWRIAQVTDLSFGWAMFLHDDIWLGAGYQGEDGLGVEYPEKYELSSLHWNADAPDGLAKRNIGSTNNDPEDGPQFANAGKFNSSLQVFSIQLTQHF